MGEEHRIRKKQIHFFVTDEEYKILKDKADYVYMNVSQFCRKIILENNIIKVPVEEIIETSQAINQYKFELNKIGNNLNQIIKVVHENNDLYEEEQLQEIKSLLESITISFNELTKEMYERLYNVAGKD